MRVFPKTIKFSAALAALIFYIITAGGAEINLLSLMPSYTAVAGRADTGKLRTFFPEIAAPGVKNAAFGCDANGKRVTLILQFADLESWQKMWKKLSPHMEPMPAERRILLFKIKNADSFFNNGHFAVLAPLVAAFYANSPGNQPFRCDYAGISENLAKAIPESQLLAIAGFPRTQQEPFRQIRSIRIYVTQNQQNLLLKGSISCRKPLHASLTHVALLSALSKSPLSLNPTPPPVSCAIS
jgi:hypothetical protein